jgi:hypothetical protein
MPSGRARGIALAGRIIQATAVLGVIIGVAYARVIISGEGEIAKSTAALRAGDAHEATVRARRAAGWYAPGAPHVRVAYERLAALATTAEGLGDRELALFAWRGIRTAAMETRWLVTPYAGELDRANQAIARLSAAAPRPPGTRTESPQQVERAHLEVLLRDETPRMGWVAVLVVGFSAWVLGAIYAARRAVSETGAILWQRAKGGILVTGIGIALWLLAIWRA